MSSPNFFTEGEQIKSLIACVKKQLKLSRCQIRKIRGVDNSYHITTPEGDCFWFYFYCGEGGSWHLERTLGERFACGQTYIYEETIKAHIRHCVSTLEFEP